eukprot:GHVH01013550.1.p1 GENE.GHVH01013550.1~~GHVH01013550.1.p1  ORF type:complete len:1230 (+),score=171.88 GHVH01013550.1:461-3691(+)
MTVVVDVIGSKRDAPLHQSLSMRPGHCRSIATADCHHLFFDCGQAIRSMGFSSPYLPLMQHYTAWRPLLEFPASAETSNHSDPVRFSARRSRGARGGSSRSSVVRDHCSPAQDASSYVFIHEGLHQSDPPPSPTPPHSRSRRTSSSNQLTRVKSWLACEEDEDELFQSQSDFEESQESLDPLPDALGANAMHSKQPSSSPPSQLPAGMLATESTPRRTVKPKADRGDIKSIHKVNSLPSWNEVNQGIGADGIPTILPHANEDSVIVSFLHKMGATETLVEPLTQTPKSPKAPVLQHPPSNLLEAISLTPSTSNSLCPRCLLATVSGPSNIPERNEPRCSTLTLWLVPLCRHESCIQALTGGGFRLGKSFILDGPGCHAQLLDVDWLDGSRDLVGGIGGVLSLTTTNNIGLFPVPISFWYTDDELAALDLAGEYPSSTPQWLLEVDSAFYPILSQELVLLRSIRTTCRSEPHADPFKLHCVHGLEMRHDSEIISCGAAKLIWPTCSARGSVPLELTVPVPERGRGDGSPFCDGSELVWSLNDLRGSDDEPFIALILGKSTGSLLWQNASFLATAPESLAPCSHWDVSRPSYMKAHRDDEASQPASRPMVVKFSPDPTCSLFVVGRASSQVSVYDLLPSAHFPQGTPILEWESAHRHTVDISWSPIQRYLISAHTAGLMHNIESFETTNHAVHRSMLHSEKKVPISVQQSDKAYNQWKARRDKAVATVVKSMMSEANLHTYPTFPFPVKDPFQVQMGDISVVANYTPGPIGILTCLEGMHNQETPRVFALFKTFEGFPWSDPRLETIRALGEIIPSGAGIERRSLSCAVSGSRVMFGFDDGVSVACNVVDLERKTYDRAMVVSTSPLPALTQRPGCSEYIAIEVVDRAHSSKVKLDDSAVDTDDTLMANGACRLMEKYIAHFNKMDNWGKVEFHSFEYDPNTGTATMTIPERLGIKMVVGRLSDQKSRSSNLDQATKKTENMNKKNVQIMQSDRFLTVKHEPNDSCMTTEPWLTEEQCASILMRSATWDGSGSDFPSGFLACSALGSVDTWRSAIGMSSPWIATCNRGGLVHLHNSLE